MRRSILWVFLLLLSLGALPTPAEASPITYAFLGTLGDCPDHIHDTCFNGWTGQQVAGTFTFDFDTFTFPEFGFAKLGPENGFSWLGPFYPTPPPDPTSHTRYETSTFGSTPSFMHFQLNLSDDFFGGLFERFDVDLSFVQPLTPDSGSALSGGWITRFGAPGNLIFPFVSDAVTPTAVPEPASWSLVSGPVVFLMARHLIRRRGQGSALRS